MPVRNGQRTDCVRCHWSICLQTFESLDLPKPILKALRDLGYDTPTPIQAQSIPPAMEGLDVLGSAQTGTGKSAAFAIPTLSRLMSRKPDKKGRGPVRPRVLVLSPTRELASQIEESFINYGRHTGLRTTAIFGGVSQFHQVKALKRGVEIIVATPGRLMDLMQQGYVDLSAIEVFILDEADRMLDMGFIDPIRRIASKVPSERQTLLFSATMPKEIMHLANSLLTDPVRVAVDPVASAAPKIEQGIYFVQKPQKSALMQHLLTDNDVERAIVFTRTKHGADKLAKVLARGGVPSSTIHGNKSQNQRKLALSLFRSGKSRVLVATDVAARGLDVDDITHVYNYDLPMEAEAYVHRIGRTGRAGKTGIAISLCDKSERGLLRAIERLTGDRIDAISMPEELPKIEPAPPSERSEKDRRDHHERPRRGAPGPKRNAGGERGRTRRPRSEDSGSAQPATGDKRRRKPNKSSAQYSGQSEGQSSGKPAGKPGGKQFNKAGAKPGGKSGGRTSGRSGGRSASAPTNNAKPGLGAGKPGQRNTRGKAMPRPAK